MNITIPEYNKAKFEDAVAKLQRKAEKLGVPVPEVTLVGFNTESFVDELGRRFVYRYAAYEYTHNNAIVLNGWKFLASVDHDSVGNIVFSNDEAKDYITVDLHTVKANCEHCNAKRDRKKTIFAVDEKGLVKQIGSTCAKDFFGNQSILNIAFSAGWAEELKEEFEERASGGRPEYDLTFVLAYAAFFIRNFGYGSSQSELPTQHLIRMEFSKPQNKPSLEDFDTAKATIEWASSLEPTNDYLNNVRSLALRGSLRDKHIGLASSMVYAYQKSLVSKSKNEIVGKHLFTIGDKFGMSKSSLGPLKVEVASVNTFEGYYGYKTAIGFQTEDGDRLVWFKSGFADGIEAGQSVLLGGTVKDHARNNRTGNPETVLIRCRVTPA
jgi:hypothetical protein